MTKPAQTKSFREILAERCSTAPLAIDGDLLDEAAYATGGIIHPAANAVEAAVPGGTGAFVNRETRTGYVMVSGVIEPFSNELYDWFGLSYAPLDRIERQLVALRDLETVDQIVMVFHSPGGSTFGMPEAAALIREVGAVKPITAYIGYLCASAAYWLASQCNEIVASPSALIGSIGAYIMHVDYSQALEQDGVRVTYIKRPDAKTEGNAYEPLSDSAKAQLQAVVDDSYNAFVSDIGQKRTLDIGQKPNDYARVSVASRAIDLKLIDRVETFATFVSGFAKQSSVTTTRRARLDIMTRKV